MDISNDSQQAVDPIEYLTKKFPADLKLYVAVRDELVTRQGALSAAQETMRLLEQTKVTTENAKAEAAQLVADAKDANAKAKAAKSVQDAREKELDVQIEQNAIKFAQLEAEYSAREMAVLTRESNATQREDKLKADLAALAEGQDALAARVKAFQDKAAALSA
jgi:chromosome segregation ATPase